MDNDMTENDKARRFKVLVCIDGSKESYRGLRYAVRLGSNIKADITLLYIRQVDKELHTGGLDIRMARENMLEWGLEMPGMTSLKLARDILIEDGYLDEDWRTITSHVDIQGDPLGDNLVEYTSKEGCKVTLKLMVSPSPDLGILDEGEMGDYDVTILSASDDNTQSEKNLMFSGSVSQVVATASAKTVIVAKALEENHGHLLCLSGSDASFNAAMRDAVLASKCNCPIFLFSVASDESKVEAANSIIAKARTAIEAAGYPIAGEKVAIGDTVEQIVEEGQNYSLIVLSGEHQRGFRRFFKSSLTYHILNSAKNSVMLNR